MWAGVGGVDPPLRSLALGIPEFSDLVRYSYHVLSSFFNLISKLHANPDFYTRIGQNPFSWPPISPGPQKG